MQPNQVVIPPNSAGFGAPLLPLERADVFLFSMMDEKINPVRVAFGRELASAVASLATTHAHLRLAHHPISKHRTIMPLRVDEAYGLMRRSLLCPIIEGDLPYQHRLFDAITAGCLPLLLREAQPSPRGVEKMGGPTCERWSWSRSSVQVSPVVGPAGRAKTRVPVCVADHYPFPSHPDIDYRQFTVQIPAEALKQPGGLARELAALADRRGELERKREHLARVRRHFVYDGDPDAGAFEAVMLEVCRALNGTANGGWRGGVRGEWWGGDHTWKGADLV